jgi:hypothetical protein
MPPDLLGPTAALVGAVIAVGALWREHIRAVADVRAQRDLATAGWRAQTDATNRLADLIEGMAHNPKPGTR